MILPKQYMKLSSAERAGFMKAISDAFTNIDRIRYPYIDENIKSDDSRMELIERIINETYSKSLTPNMEQVFNKIEFSLAD